jgi:acetylxylan esterase
MFGSSNSDATLFYENFGEEIKEWTNVLGDSQTPSTTSLNNPQSGYTKTTYGNNVVAYSAEGVGHTVPVHETIDLAWFGITR